MTVDVILCVYCAGRNAGCHLDWRNAVYCLPLWLVSYLHQGITIASVPTKWSRFMCHASHFWYHSILRKAGGVWLQFGLSMGCRQFVEKADDFISWCFLCTLVFCILDWGLYSSRHAMPLWVMTLQESCHWLTMVTEHLRFALAHILTFCNLALSFKPCRAYFS